MGFNFKKPARAGHVYTKHDHIMWNGKKASFRSSYELEYAKKLDRQKVDYETETLKIPYWDTQQRKKRIAVPDFYIPATNTIIEVKGQFYYDEKEMIDRFIAYRDEGYKCVLILDGFPKTLKY